MIGKTLGHYQITSQLGKGGMGEVFQAKDQKLGRDVAIKVLPDEFAKDTDRIARFQREAKLLASLNHPNIAAIYGLEESGGANFLVLELVEGQTLSMEGDRKWEPLLQEKQLAAQPQISPDGQWIAYTSDMSGENQIYVRPFPDVNKDRFQVSTGGGDNPLWSLPDGKELFYLDGDAVMAVSVQSGPTFNAGKPKILFRRTHTNIRWPSIEFRIWDISPDGKRFLMMEELENDSAEAGHQKINVVLNWFEELKQRVPK
jgi:hypothetical protein